MRATIFVIGTRAQLVKMAPVLQEACKSKLDHKVWFSGQHRESINDLVEDFQLESTFIMPACHQERASVRSLMRWLVPAVSACTRFLRKTARETGCSPVVVVHGDTLSALLGAICAKAVNAPVVHVESGLTSGSLSDPFPEELIRRGVFRLAYLAICPNHQAESFMRKRRVKRVVNSGENTLLDAVRFAIGRSEHLPPRPAYAVASIHRFQNIYSRKRLARLVDELTELSLQIPVDFVLHPSTQRRLGETGLMGRLQSSPHVSLAPRMPFTRFIFLLSRAQLVVSDGGSNQEELSYLGVPTVLMRERSERPDGIGRNVVFESELPVGGLLQYVRSGQADQSRHAPRLDEPVSPSRTVVAAIADLAGDR